MSLCVIVALINLMYKRKFCMVMTHGDESLSCWIVCYLDHFELGICKDRHKEWLRRHKEWLPYKLLGGGSDVKLLHPRGLIDRRWENILK